MGRYGSGGSYDHHCAPFGRYGDTFLISWTVDYYYEGSRLRWPRVFSRVTDEAGAKRFCKKWGLEFEEKTPQ